MGSTMGVSLTNEIACDAGVIRLRRELCCQPGEDDRDHRLPTNLVLARMPVLRRRKIFK